MGTVRGARRDGHQANSHTGPVALAATFCVLLLGLGAGATAVSAGIDQGSRVLVLAVSGLGVLASAAFMGSGLLLFAVSRYQQSALATRCSAALVINGGSMLLPILARALDPDHPASTVGPLTRVAAALVCAGLLGHAVLREGLGPVRAVRVAALSAGLLAVVGTLLAVQLSAPGVLDAGPAVHAALETLGGAAWVAVGAAALLRGEHVSGAITSRLVGVVALLLGFGHVLRALDGGPVALFSLGAAGGRLVLGLVVLVWATRLIRSAADRADRSRAQLSSSLLDAVDAAQVEERVRAQLVHDVRNACAGVRGALEILMDHEAELDDATVARLRQVAMFGMEHLEQIVSRTDPTARDFDVTEVVHRVVDGRRTVGAVVAVLGEHVSAHGRPHALATALLNVLVNAERHAPGTAVTVDVSRVGDEVRVCVVDSGPGIAPDARESIFLGGHRGPESTGQGLGLHIARTAMVAQGGDLTLARPGPGAAGAAFVLRLPATSVCPDVPVEPTARDLSARLNRA